MQCNALENYKGVPLTLPQSQFTHFVYFIFHIEFKTYSLRENHFFEEFPKVALTRVSQYPGENEGKEVRKSKASEIVKS